jgi:succinoglycan biosynthesis transport protein ExoP
MDITLYLRLLRKWWWLFAAAFLVGGGLAYGVSLRLTPTYQATTTLLVVQRQTEGSVNLTDIQTAERLANTFSRLVTIRPVLQQAIADAGLPFSITQLEDRLVVRNPPSTQLLEVSAKSNDPELAATMANAVVTSFISSNQANLSNRPGLVSVVERAEPPLGPIAPRPMLNAALGALLLLFVAAGVVLLVEYLDDTVKSPEQASEISGLPALGRIEQFEKTRSPRDQLQAAHRPRSTVAEAYRAARTNLSYAIDLGRDRRLVLVTSPGPGEGKTTTVANLAVVFGLAGHRVCVIDTDLRRPTLHRLFGLDNQEGLTNLLLAREPDLERAIQRTVYTNVSALTSGPLPPNPSELLGSARMQEVLERLKARFDVVLLDSPPALVVTDASVLATLADGLLIVTRARHTRTDQLRATVEELAQSGRPIAGIIINRVASRDSYYYYGTGYGRAYGEVPDREAAAERLRVGDLTATQEASTSSSNGDAGDGRWARDAESEAEREAGREPLATVILDEPAAPSLDDAEDGTPRDHGRDRGV